MRLQETINSFLSFHAVDQFGPCRPRQVAQALLPTFASVCNNTQSTLSCQHKHPDVRRHPDTLYVQCSYAIQQHMHSSYTFFQSITPRWTLVWSQQSSTNSSGTAWSSSYPCLCSAVAQNDAARDAGMSQTTRKRDCNMDVGRGKHVQCQCRRYSL